MPVVPVNGQFPEPDVIARAAEILRTGGLVAFPTETVYGLGAHGLNANAVAKIFEAKGRPAWNPVILHVANTEQARKLSARWPDEAERLAKAFWPGPMTLVLPKVALVPDIVTAGLPAVAIRVPAHPVALALIDALGAPIAAPSANRFTGLSPTSAEHVLSSLGTRVDLILDGGPANVGIESTVIDLSGRTPTLLRPGTIAPHELELALGFALTRPNEDSERDNTPRVSPGRVERHYAPQAEVWLVDSDDAASLTEATGERRRKNSAEKIAALVLDWSLPLPPSVHTVRMPRDPLAYARALYASLHDLDAEGFTIVAIERPPQTGAWAGVHDRLTRASHRLATHGGADTSRSQDSSHASN